VSAGAEDIPVRLEAVAAHLRVFVTNTWRDARHSAALWGHGDRFTVDLNASLGVLERRVVCARAFAHVVLYGDLVKQGKLEVMMRSKWREAEQFALELLMPPHLLLPVAWNWQVAGMPRDTLERCLARSFQVPMPMVQPFLEQCMAFVPESIDARCEALR
jgi:Zn-dependent peptidase ImmA (M78 family)